MGTINTNSAQPLVNAQNVQKPQAQTTEKPEAKETPASELKASTLEKIGETEFGQFYKKSPWIAGVGTGIAGLATVGLGLKYEGLGELLFNRGTGGILSAGVGYVLAEDGIKDLREGSHIKGALKTTVGGVGVLGGAELLTKVPVLTKPIEIAFENGYAFGGTALGAGATYMLYDGVKDIQNGDKLAGGLKAATGVVGGLGAVELVGRQFEKSLIIEPLKKFATAKGAQGAGAALGATAGAGLLVDGAKRFTENGSVINDGIALAEVAGGALLATGSTSLAGMALGNETLKAVLPKTAKHIGGAALVGSTYVLGKETLKSMSENGVGYLNVATGTGAALSALGAAETFGFSKAFTKGGQYAGAAGLGAASVLLGKGAIDSFKNDELGEGALKGFGAVVGAGGALALADVPGFRNVGEKILEAAWDDVLAPVGTFAVKNPVLTLAALGVGAYATYKLTSDSGEEKAAEAQTQAKPAAEEN